MSWINIKKADLVEDECYSIRAERSPENHKLFPQMKKGTGKYRLNCVLLNRRIMRKGWSLTDEENQINDAGGTLEFKYIDPIWRGAHGSAGQPIRNNRIILYHAKGIEIKHVSCSAEERKREEENRGASTIQSRFRGNKGRAPLKSLGYIRTSQKVEDWPDLKRKMQASGFKPAEIEKFHRDHYMASLKKKKKKKSKRRRRSSKKKRKSKRRRRSSKKKKKSKNRKRK